MPAVFLTLSLLSAAAGPEPLPDTRPLDWDGDLAARMVAGIERYLDRALAAAPRTRREHWKPDHSSPEAYARSVEPNRRRLRTILGVVDPRRPPTGFELVATVDERPVVAETPRYRVLAVRWPVLDGVDGEGLLLQPVGAVRAAAVVLPDADVTPEAAVGLGGGADAPVTARALAEASCRVLVPVLIDRAHTWSGNARLGRFTNQPHREFLYRMAYELGRTPAGLEVQKVLAAVDHFRKADAGVPVIVAGHGEGGLVALLSAAVDDRIGAAAVAGHFGPREGLWREPIYRNTWRLLAEFGDAQIGALVAPRLLIVEATPGPAVPDPVPVGRLRGAAPGRLDPVAPQSVQAEFRRLASLVQPVPGAAAPQLAPDAPATLSALSAMLGLAVGKPAPAPADSRTGFDPAVRQRRQFEQLVEFCQRLQRGSADVRKALWAKADASSPDAWTASTQAYRERLHDVLGRMPPADRPANPRTRKVYDRPTWTGWEVVLDVTDDVFAYGILLLPKDLRPGERRPVVVCQHGLEGRPQNLCDPALKNSYEGVAARLAGRGFVVYAPQNPYIGGDAFRVLQRKANPLGLSLFSFIVRQHERTLEWLASRPDVDAGRIGFYGLSYGGKTAMRVPALLTGYRLSICSGDFNEWIHKNVSTDLPMSYMFTGEYEMPEWDLGNTFNYAEMAELICPRPFMVERGHHDGVGLDEWVAFEYAKVRRRYALLGIAGRTEIEFFNGGHKIHGAGTFEFLHRHLDWPKR